MNILRNAEKSTARRVGQAPCKGTIAFPALLFVFLSFPPLAGRADTFAVGPLADGILLGGSLVIGGASELFFHTSEPVDLGLADPGKINGFDRIAVFGYSRGLDLASDITLYTAVALPAVLCIFLNADGAVGVLVPYVESLALADFSKNLLKYLLPRQRPWLYMAATGGAVPDTWEGNDSFPSGHATLAFAAAVFGLFAFTTYFPNSPYLVPFAALNLGLATGTSVLRVTSGMHFLTDVLVGASLGAAFGALIPILHESTQWRALTGKSVPPVQVQLLTIPL